MLVSVTDDWRLLPHIASTGTCRVESANVVAKGARSKPWDPLFVRLQGRMLLLVPVFRSQLIALLGTLSIRLSG
jgi:hypothetical protein